MPGVFCIQSGIFYRQHVYALWAKKQRRQKPGAADIRENQFFRLCRGAGMRPPRLTNTEGELSFTGITGP